MVTQEQIDAEIENQGDSSFILWKKMNNQNEKRGTPFETLMVQNLDHVHSNVDTVTRYLNKGFEIVHANVKLPADGEGDPDAIERLGPIDALVNGQKRMAEKIRNQVLREYGLTDKVAQLRAKKAAEAEAKKAPEEGSAPPPIAPAKP